jgi:hypothetical protein
MAMSYSAKLKNSPRSTYTQERMNTLRIILEHLIVFNNDPLIQEKFMNYFQQTPDFIECMKLIQAIEILNTNITISNQRKNIFVALQSNEILFNIDSNLKNKILKLRGNLNNLISKLPVFYKVNENGDQERYGKYCAVSFDHFYTHNLKQFQDFWTSYYNCNRRFHHNFTFLKQLYLDKRYHRVRAQKERELMININELESKIAQHSNKLSQSCFKIQKEALTRKLVALRQPLYFIDFIDIISTCVQRIMNVYYRINYETISVPKTMDTIDYNTAFATLPNGTIEPRTESRNRSWSSSSHDDARFLDNMRNAASNQVQNWSSSLKVREVKDDDDQEISDDMINREIFNELEYNIRQEKNSLHKEYLKLGKDYFAIIISDMPIKKKISECINSYRTPEHLVQKVKKLVGRYEDQNGIIVHSFPEDIVRSYAYASSRQRRDSIKKEWRQETMKTLVARAIDDLDGYDKRYDRYGRNSLQYIAKSTLRKKIIYKAFEYLISNNMINLDTIFDIFTFNNCEFLKYAENNIDGYNNDIRKYELGSLLYTHMSE